MKLSENKFPIIMEELYYSAFLTNSFAQVPVRLTDRRMEQRPTSFEYRPRVFYSYLKFLLRAFGGQSRSGLIRKTKKDDIGIGFRCTGMLGSMLTDELSRRPAIQLSSSHRPKSDASHIGEIARARGGQHPRHARFMKRRRIGEGDLCSAKSFDCSSTIFTK